MGKPAELVKLIVATPVVLLAFTVSVVAPTAVVVGAVTMGPRSSIWYGAVARADFEQIEIGEDSNVQDGCTLHSDPGGGHGHTHYAVVSDPVREGGEQVAEVVHGAARINEIEDASDDPAAVE